MKGENFMKLTSTKPFTPLSTRHPIICHICNEYTARWLIVVDEIIHILSCDNCRCLDVGEIVENL